MKKTLYLFLFICSKILAQGTHLPISQFEAKLETTPNAQLVDLRTPSEFNRGHIKKAQNINFNDDEFDELVNAKLDKNKPVFIYCFSGERSANAVIYLKDLGFKQVYDMEGGFAKWIASSKPYSSSSKTTEPIAAYTKENVDKIIKTNATVLIEFYADWCAPCKKMLPILYKLANERKTLKFLKLDAEINDSVASFFEVEEVPTYVIFKNGRQVWKSSGEIPEDEFRDILKRLKI